jgi:plastocyanin
LVKDTVLVGPGERYDLEVAATHPGVWMFHCHMPNHMENGMMTTLVYDGFEVGPGLHAHHQAPNAPPAPASNAPAALAPAPPEAAAAVTMLGDRFDRSSLTVAAGTTVRWTNTSVNLHTVTAFDGSFDGGVVAPGASTSVTFDIPGTYRYYCRQHILGGMLGTVVVT